MPRKKTETPKVSETKKKSSATRKSTTKKPVTRKKPTSKPKEVEYVVLNWEEEFPYDMFPWKLIYKEGAEKRTCYFQCEDHRKKHIMRYNINKKNIIFMGYKYEWQS